MLRLMIVSLVYFWCAGIASPASAAQDDGLYAPAAPAGSAFVRFIHADAKHQKDTPKLDGKSYGDEGFQSVSPYYVTPQGHKTFVFGGKEQRQDLAEGKFYSAVLTGSGLNVLEDHSVKTPAKALIVFCNLTGREKLVLKAAGRPINIVDGVAKGAEGAREINPVKIGLDVFDGDKKIASVDPVLLDRGAAYGVIAFDKGSGDIAVTVTRAETDTRK